jgi:hypothetical protein
MTFDQPTTAETAKPPLQRANGAATYFGVLFAPGEAFDTLARVPLWGWACVLGMVITVIAVIVGLPATLHVIQVAQAAQIAQAPADQQQQMRDTISKISPIMPVIITCTALIAPWIGWVIASLVILAGSAIGRGATSFGTAWVLAVNSYAILAFGALLNNIVLRLQGAENITKTSDAYALPSLAMLVHGDAKVSAFLYAFNVVYIWFYAIIAFGMQRMMKVSAAAAWGTAIVYALIGALIAMAFAK